MKHENLLKHFAAASTFPPVIVIAHHPVDYNAFMLRVLIIYSTHILCFFMCSYFTLLNDADKHSDSECELRVEMQEGKGEKSNNFNCILRF